MKINKSRQPNTQLDRDSVTLLNRLLWIKKSRKKAFFLADLFETIEKPDLAGRIAGCFAKLRIEIFQDHVGVTSFDHCGIRVCPFCSYRWASRKARYYEPYLREFSAKGYRLQYLTLTIANVPFLDKPFLQELWECWKKLRRQKLFKVYIATLACMEIERNENGWHPHLHIILVGGERVSEAAIRPAWSKLTDGSFNLNLRSIKPHKIQSVIKYSLKITRIKYDEDLRQLYNAIYKLDLIRPSGALFGLGSYADDNSGYIYKHWDTLPNNPPLISSFSADTFDLNGLIRHLGEFLASPFLDGE